MSLLKTMNFSIQYFEYEIVFIMTQHKLSLMCTKISNHAKVKSTWIQVETLLT